MEEEPLMLQFRVRAPRACTLLLARFALLVGADHCLTVAFEHLLIVKANG